MVRAPEAPSHRAQNGPDAKTFAYVAHEAVHGPMEVPGGSWIIQALDPQGAMFALVGTRAQVEEGA